MSYVYPRAPVVAPETPAFNVSACAVKIVQMREDDEDMTLERAMGHLLAAGGGTPDDVKRVWVEIVKEAKALRAVSPADHSTATSFTTALATVAKHLDPAVWYDGLKDELKVTTWADLKDKFTVQEL